MRVAVRRSRALLRAGQGADRDRHRGAHARAALARRGARLRPRPRRPARAAARRSGRARRRSTARRPNRLLRALERERTRARRALLKALDGARYLTLLDPSRRRWPGSSRARRSATLDALARRQLKKLDRAVRALGPDPADAELHELRKLGKRTRYAFELAGNGRAVRRAQELQDVLGEHQDAVVAEQRLRSLAADAPAGPGARGRAADRGRAAPARACARNLAEGMETRSSARRRDRRPGGRRPRPPGRRARTGGSRRTPPQVRRLDVSEGEGRRRRERRGLRAARGRRGDGAPLRARVGRRHDGVRRRERAAEARALVGDASRSRTAASFPNDEIDELRWVALGDAARLLTYDRDVALLDRVR